MPYRPEADGCCSVFSFAKRTEPFSRSAAIPNWGAIARHGPHQGAQKSTTKGNALS